ncbi:MAG: ATP-binding cassette domain-containing protein, partial [Clostridiales bacterium]|nr:ATP-binding cassette domain-containing protein [Clostridiales bacterium]
VKVGNGVLAPSLGAVIENAELFGNLTSFENLSILNSFSENKISEDEIRGWIDKFGLDSFDKKKYSEFSLGMRQRLSLAQAFMEEPELIVLDEPTNALDENGVAEFHKIAREANKKGATIIMASHSREDIDALCTGIFYLYEGKIKIKGEKI